MKKFLLLLVLAVFTVGLNAQADAEVRIATEWTWFGIDYTNCYFLTKMDFPSVSDLESKIMAWNNLPLMEREKFFDKTLPNKDINYFTEITEKNNSEIDVKSRLSNDNSLSEHMEKSQIEIIIGSYTIPDDQSGIGLVFIAESYSKPNEQGAYYVTFFDIKTKNIISSQRMLGKAKGFGLRNFWANSYYVTLKDLGKIYK